MPKTIATTPSWYWPDLIPRAIGIPPFAIGDFLITRFANQLQDETVFVSEKTEYSFLEVLNLTDKIAASIREKRSSDDQLNIGMLLGQSPQAALIFLAALKSNSKVYLIDDQNLDSYDFKNLKLDFFTGDFDKSLFENKTKLTDVIYYSFEDLKDSVLDQNNSDLNKLNLFISDVNINEPQICLRGKFGLTWHSQRSLLAGALSFASFLEGSTIVKQRSENTWLNYYCLSVWEGVVGLLTSLINGSKTYFCETADQVVNTINEYAPNYILCDFEKSAEFIGQLGRKKRSSLNSNQAALLGINGEFSPDARREVSNSLGSALTFYGTGETLIMVSAHPSWYIDEAVGIAIPNMHIVPADPDTFEPIDTLWELLDEAVISAWSPSLSTSYNGNLIDHIKDGRFITESLAASDPNGMLYLLDA